jgi:hypothetical protein
LEDRQRSSVGEVGKVPVSKGVWHQIVCLFFNLGIVASFLCLLFPSKNAGQFHLLSFSQFDKAFCAQWLTVPL